MSVPLPCHDRRIPAFGSVGAVGGIGGDGGSGPAGGWPGPTPRRRWVVRSGEEVTALAEVHPEGSLVVAMVCAEVGSFGAAVRGARRWPEQAKCRDDGPSAPNQRLLLRK